MINFDDKIEQLKQKLELLNRKQDFITEEINVLKNEINQLRVTELIEASTSDKKELSKSTQLTSTKFLRNLDNKILGGVCSGLGDYLQIEAVWIRLLWLIVTFASMGVGVVVYFILWVVIPAKEKSINSSSWTTENNLNEEALPKKKTTLFIKTPANLEKFIGENLFNKIGIIITIIGVSIGVKYSIDHNLISPTTRILLGYLFGLVLLGFSLKLKNNYKNFSAVLLSGSMAILYLITFTAYSYYGLLPQLITFSLMVLFTLVTVIAALQYNKEIIAHIGLVGAYAIPSLLSEDTENPTLLFSYMLIINLGILVISFKKYWKALFYASFIITWLIYYTWFSLDFQIEEHFSISFLFLTLFYFLFYSTFLAYKLIKKEKYDVGDIVLLLSNSFIFYGIGYQTLFQQESGEHFLGLFTLLNALIHSMVSVVIYRQKLADRNLYYFVSGLVLIFVTMAIPVQLNGNWVTLLWAGEAVILFWIGRTKQIPFYEYLAYPLLILSFFSIIQDYNSSYQLVLFSDVKEHFYPVLNVHFLSSLLFACSIGTILYISNQEKYHSPLPSNQVFSKFITILIPSLLIFVLYFSFKVEITHYFNQSYLDSKIVTSMAAPFKKTIYDSDLLKYGAIWTINYTLLFFTILSFIAIKLSKSKLLGYFNLLATTFVLFVFLTEGLYTLSELRDSYLTQSLSEFYHIGIMNISIRYISFALVIGLLLVSHQFIKQEFIKKDLKVAFEFLIHLTLLWILSSELINWMAINSFSNSYKLGLSILWGSYSLFLIIMGIWKNKKYLRIGAISLFAITLLKLFLYDIANLDTISKTFVFVILGLLLLIISFLYNKYKHFILYDD